MLKTTIPVTNGRPVEHECEHCGHDRRRCEECGHAWDQHDQANVCLCCPNTVGPCDGTYTLAEPLVWQVRPATRLDPPDYDEKELCLDCGESWINRGDDEPDYDPMDEYERRQRRFEED